MSPRTLLDLLIAAAVFLLLLAPVGFALLRWAGRRAGPEDLALALGLGYAVVLPLLLGELWSGIPGLALAAAILALVSLRRELRALLALRALAPLLALPALLFLLGVWVNMGDLHAGADGLSFRSGADVSDRVLYAMIAREVGRLPPPNTENPVFAGARLTYSFFPALLALLLERYASLPLLATFLLPLPAIGLGFTGLAADRLLRAMSVTSTWKRASSVLLAVLGGDLAWAIPAPNLTALERTRYLSIFWSQSEWLFFNTWVLAAPLALVLLTLLRLWSREPRPRDMLLFALLSGALFETKVFTLIPILGAVAIVGTILRRRAWAMLTLALGLGLGPWLLLTRLSAGEDAGFLAWAPLLLVKNMLTHVPVLQKLNQAGVAVAWIFGTLIFLVVGLGIRIFGLALLAREARRDNSGFDAAVASCVVLSIALSLTLAVRPVWYDNSQFLLLPQFLLGSYTASSLFKAWRRRRLRALVIAAWLVVPLAPLHYLLTKKFTLALTPPEAWDRKRQLLSPASVTAALWLDEHAARSDRLALPLEGDPEDLDGLKPFYVSALSRRGLLAARLAFHLPQAEASRRGNDALSLYATDRADEALAILTRWRVRWVWENAGQPLRFRSDRLRLAFAGGPVRLYELR